MKIRNFFGGLLFAAMLAAVAGCGGGAPASGGNPPPPPPAPPPGNFQAAPLNDLGSGTYQGFSGGLYPNGGNAVSAQHNAAGLARANAVRPLDTTGNPSATGKIVLLSIGMSNTTQEFCSASSDPPCNAWTFMGQAAADAGVNHATLAIVNGAMGGRSANFWTSAAAADYDRIRDTKLVPQGLGEKQVQAVWLKVADAGPTVSLPSQQADAFLLEMEMGNILRALKTRYPNLQQVFVSSRIYAGYATTTLNPEPYAYESGFAVKWLLQAQMDQIQNGGTIVDARAGDLNYNTVAPWAAWGPCLWASGTTARSDGLKWDPGDFESDGTHPAQSGETKVGTMLLNFFKTSPYTKCWFLTNGACP